MSHSLEPARLREVWCRRELEKLDRHASDSEADQRRRRKLQGDLDRARHDLSPSARATTPPSLSGAAMSRVSTCDALHRTMLACWRSSCCCGCRK